MGADNIGLLYFAAAVAICLVVREMRWRGRVRRWVKGEGKVTGFDQSHPKVHCPIIGYRYDGKAREQVCGYSLYAPRLSETVPILIDPNSGRISMASFRDRWFLSAFLGGLLVVLVIIYISCSERFLSLGSQASSRNRTPNTSWVATANKLFVRFAL